MPTSRTVSLIPSALETCPSSFQGICQECSSISTFLFVFLMAWNAFFSSHNSYPHFIQVSSNTILLGWEDGASLMTQSEIVPVSPSHLWSLVLLTFLQSPYHPLYVLWFCSTPYCYHNTHLVLWSQGFDLSCLLLYQKYI